MCTEHHDTENLGAENFSSDDSFQENSFTETPHTDDPNTDELGPRGGEKTRGLSVCRTHGAHFRAILRLLNYLVYTIRY